jgi:hypothetical protein
MVSMRAEMQTRDVNGREGRGKCEGEGEEAAGSDACSGCSGHCWRVGRRKSLEGTQRSGDLDDDIHVAQHGRREHQQSCMDGRGRKTRLTQGVEHCDWLGLGRR